jgi:hypothetical protein
MNWPMASLIGQVIGHPHAHDAADRCDPGFSVSQVLTLSFLHICYANLKEREHLEDLGIDGS